jgi:hypothetical protein
MKCHLFTAVSNLSRWKIGPYLAQPQSLESKGITDAAYRRLGPLPLLANLDTHDDIEEGVSAQSTKNRSGLAFFIYFHPHFLWIVTPPSL